MVCPYCYQNTKVTNSRSHQAGFSVWRRRQCLKCQTNFTTTEQIVLESIIHFKDEQGALKPLRRLDLYIVISKALDGLKDAPVATEHLTRNCIYKLLKQGQPVLELNQAQKIIYQTLKAFNPLVGQRYLLNEVGRLKI